MPCSFVDVACIFKWICLFASDVDPVSSRRQLCGGSPAAVDRMLQFGRELYAMNEQLKREFGTNEANKKALRVSSSGCKHPGITT